MKPLPKCPSRGPLAATPRSAQGPPLPHTHTAASFSPPRKSRAFALGMKLSDEKRRIPSFLPLPACTVPGPICPACKGTCPSRPSPDLLLWLPNTKTISLVCRQKKWSNDPSGFSPNGPAGVFRRGPGPANCPAVLELSPSTPMRIGVDTAPGNFFRAGPLHVLFCRQSGSENVGGARLFQLRNSGAKNEKALTLAEGWSAGQSPAEKRALEHKRLNILSDKNSPAAGRLDASPLPPMGGLMGPAAPSPPASLKNDGPLGGCFRPPK